MQPNAAHGAALEAGQGRQCVETNPRIVPTLLQNVIHLDMCAPHPPADGMAGAGGVLVQERLCTCLLQRVVKNECSHCPLLCLLPKPPTHHLSCSGCLSPPLLRPAASLPTCCCPAWVPPSWLTWASGAFAAPLLGRGMLMQVVVAGGTPLGDALERHLLGLR